MSPVQKSDGVCYLHPLAMLFTYLSRGFTLGLRAKRQLWQFCSGSCGGDLDLAVVCSMKGRSQGRGKS